MNHLAIKNLEDSILFLKDKISSLKECLKKAKEDVKKYETIIEESDKKIIAYKKAIEKLRVD